MDTYLQANAWIYSIVQSQLFCWYSHIFAPIRGNPVEMILMPTRMIDLLFFVQLTPRLMQYAPVKVMSALGLQFTNAI